MTLKCQAGTRDHVAPRNAGKTLREQHQSFMDMWRRIGVEPAEPLVRLGVEPREEVESRTGTWEEEEEEEGERGLFVCSPATDHPGSSAAGPSVPASAPSASPSTLTSPHSTHSPPPFVPARPPIPPGTPLLSVPLRATLWVPLHATSTAGGGGRGSGTPVQRLAIALLQAVCGTGEGGMGAGEGEEGRGEVGMEAGGEKQTQVEEEGTSFETSQQMAGSIWWQYAEELLPSEIEARDILTLADWSDEDIERLQSFSAAGKSGPAAAEVRAYAAEMAAMEAAVAVAVPRAGRERARWALRVVTSRSFSISNAADPAGAAGAVESRGATTESLLREGGGGDGGGGGGGGSAELLPSAFQVGSSFAILCPLVRLVGQAQSHLLHFHSWHRRRNSPVVLYSAAAVLVVLYSAAAVLVVLYSAAAVLVVLYSAAAVLVVLYSAAAVLVVLYSAAAVLVVLYSAAAVLVVLYSAAAVFVVLYSAAAVLVVLYSAAAVLVVLYSAAAVLVVLYSAAAVLVVLYSAAAVLVVLYSAAAVLVVLYSAAAVLVVLYSAAAVLVVLYSAAAVLVVLYSAAAVLVVLYSAAAVLVVLYSAAAVLVVLYSAAAVLVVLYSAAAVLVVLYSAAAVLVVLYSAAAVLVVLYSAAAVLVVLYSAAAVLVVLYSAAAVLVVLYSAAAVLVVLYSAAAVLVVCAVLVPLVDMANHARNAATSGFTRGHAAVLVPLVDMANHACSTATESHAAVQPSATWRIRRGRTQGPASALLPLRFEVLASRPLRPGAQATISYNPFSKLSTVTFLACPTSPPHPHRPLRALSYSHLAPSVPAPSDHLGSSSAPGPPRFELLASRPLRPGAQVTISYGPLTSLAFLLSFGFLPRSNPANRITIYSHSEQMMDDVEERVTRLQHKRHLLSQMTPEDAPLLAYTAQAAPVRPSSLLSQMTPEDAPLLAYTGEALVSARLYCYGLCSPLLLWSLLAFTAMVSARLYCYGLCSPLLLWSLLAFTAMVSTRLYCYGLYSPLLLWSLLAFTAMVPPSPHLHWRHSNKADGVRHSNKADGVSARTACIISKPARSPRPPTCPSLSHFLSALPLSIHHAHSGGIATRLMECLLVLHASSAEELAHLDHQWTASRSLAAANVSPRTRSIAAKQLVDRCRELLNDYPTTLQADEAQLEQLKGPVVNDEQREGRGSAGSEGSGHEQEGKMRRRMQAAVEYRVEEKRILADAVARYGRMVLV
ncbi:unnamed protein product [Closterium sp. NIES-64]|nr:unnamed protein product [Closterium sp. NIES-64]